MAVPSGATQSGNSKIVDVQNQIEAIQAEREAAMEDHVEDREIKIYNQKANVASQAMNTN